MKVNFTVPGIPTPWARAGRHGGIMFTPGKQRAAMTDVKMFAMKAMVGKPLMTGAVEMVITFQYPWPKSVSAKKRSTYDARWKDSRPDLSNLVKLIEDAMNGIVYCDDAQIAVEHISKTYADVPGIEVEIITLKDPLADWRDIRVGETVA